MFLRCSRLEFQRVYDFHLKLRRIHPSELIMYRTISRNSRSVFSQETSLTANGYSKQSSAGPISANHSVPIWEVSESELKPFSNGDAAIKTTLKLLEKAEWLVSFYIYI